MGRGLSEWTGPSVRRKRLCLFRREKLRPHARTRCPPEAANSHTVRPRSVFPDAQVAGENGFHFLRACGRELCEAFSTSSGACPSGQAPVSFSAFCCRAAMRPPLLGLLSSLQSIRAAHDGSALSSLSRCAPSATPVKPLRLRAPFAGPLARQAVHSASRLNRLLPGAPRSVLQTAPRWSSP